MLNILFYNLYLDYLVTNLLQYFYVEFTDRDSKQPITGSWNMTSSLATGSAPPFLWASDFSQFLSKSCSQQLCESVWEKTLGEELQWHLGVVLVESSNVLCKWALIYSGWPLGPWTDFQMEATQTAVNMPSCPLTVKYIAKLFLWLHLCSSVNSLKLIFVLYTQVAVTSCHVKWQSASIRLLCAISRMCSITGLLCWKCSLRPQ